MSFFNTRERFGSSVKLSHWLLFLLVLIQYSIMVKRSFFPKESADYLWYTLLHKSFGITVLIVALLMIIASQFGKRPFLDPNTKYQNWLARTVHFTLYALVIIIPIGGILMTVLSGRALAFFGYPIVKANAIQKYPELASFFHSAHLMAAKILAVLIIVHILGALYHRFILKDNVLKRMMGFGK